MTAHGHPTMFTIKLPDVSCYLINFIILCQHSTSVRIALFWLWHRHTIVFALVYCAVDNTFCEVSTDLRCFSSITLLLLLWNNVPCLKPILNLLT